MDYKMRGMRKRVLAFLLAVVVFVTSLPVDTTRIFAEEGNTQGITFTLVDGKGELIKGKKVTVSYEVEETEEASESTESTESAENTENTESTESTENTENTESTESTENIENTESTESTENTENAESTENTEGTEVASYSVRRKNVILTGTATCEHTTDEHGQFVCADVKLPENGTVTYILDIEGYATQTAKVNVADGEFKQESVEITDVLLAIPAEDYTISDNYSGEFDTQAHSVIAEIKDAAQGKEDYRIAYSVNGEAYSADTPSFTNVGVYTVSIKIERDGYETVVAERSITITPAVINDITFGDGIPTTGVVINVDSETGEYPTYPKPATSTKAEAHGLEISYSIEKIGGEISGDEASVANDGTVTLNKPGSYIVSATVVTEGDNYMVTPVSYTIIADLKPRTNVSFEKTEETEYAISYEPSLVFENKAMDENNSDAEVNYEIIAQTRDEQDVHEDGDDTNDVAILDEVERWKLHILASGEVTVRATVGTEEDDVYAVKEIEYTLTVERADQTFDFSSITEYRTVDIVYGTKEKSFAIDANTILPTDKAINYSLEENTIATVDEETGVVTFIAGETGEVTLTASHAGDDCYNPYEAECIIKVSRKDFGTVTPNVDGEQLLSDSEWFTNNITISAPNGYKISETDSFDEAVWKEEIILEDESDVIDRNFYLMDLSEESNGAISEVYNKESDFGPFKLDKTAPGSLNIEVKESPIGAVLEILTLGFFQKQATVTLTAKDTLSGVSYFEYDIDGENNGEAPQQVVATEIEGQQDIYSAEFTIDADYKGKVSFVAVDNAGHTSEAYLSDEIIVDNSEPGITVSFADEETPNNYYSASRVVTIAVVEENFNADDVVIEATHKENGADVAVPYEITKEFTATEDVYELVHTFSEAGEYTLQVSYKDKSGNVGKINGSTDTEYETTFVIDLDAPMIDRIYADVDVPVVEKDGIRYFTDERTLTITSKDYNFNAANVEVTIEAEDVNKTPIPVNAEDYANYNAYFKDSDNWQQDAENKNIYVANPITLDTEGYYTITMKFTDEAGKVSNEISETFCIDTTAPSEMTITYEDVTWIDTLLETVSFGFFKENAKVILEATDDVAKIESFEYVFELSDDASENAEGETGTLIIGEDEEISYADGKARAELYINPQFRGHVTFTAKNEAGLANTISDDDENYHKEVIVDNDSAKIEVEYSPVDSVDEVGDVEYYNKDISATIKIFEDNFFATDKWNYADYENGNLVIEVSEREQGAAEATKINVRPEFEFVEDSENGNYYKATYIFDKTAEYKFKIEYTDRSGNDTTSYEKHFFIDKKQPEIAISYKNDVLSETGYYKADRNATITVEEMCFDAKDIDFTAIVRNVKGDELDIPDYQSILRNATWDEVAPDKYEYDLVFDVDGTYEVGMTYTDLAGYAQAVPIEERFCIDKAAPEVGEKEEAIVYSEPVAWKIFLEKFTFGFYKAPVTVTLTASDITSGIDYFIYSYKEEGAEEAVEEITVPDTELVFSEDGAKATYTFDIAQEFRGKVSFVAVDKADYRTEVEDNRTIVVDTTAPNIIVKYDNHGATVQNECYYNAERTATISIEEKNFFGIAEWGYEDFADGKIVVKKEMLIGNNEKKEGGVIPAEELDFTYVESSGCYEATVEFTEDADYTFSIEYVDRSNHEAQIENADTEEKTTKIYVEEFVIDKTAPVLEIEYEPDELKNDIYYNADRTAMVTVTEHNFNASDVQFTVTAEDVNGDPVDISTKEYGTYLQNKQNWNQNGDEYTVTLSVFDIDAMYTINMMYTDLAGNEQVKVIEDRFCVDKTKPQNLEITYSEPVEWKTFLEKFTFGFYNASATVTLSAEDMTSGIDYFEYSYKVEDGASEISVGKEGVKVIPTVRGEKATVSFDIPAQFRGKVSFDAFDKAGNKETKSGTETIVVDNIAPGVAVTYDNTDVQNDSYYKVNRTATIYIDEANFFGTKEKWDSADLYDLVPGTNEEYLVITVGKGWKHETKYPTTKVRPEFKFDKATGKYVAEVPFEEDGDYTFDIKYTDHSGNVFDSYEMDKFIIDKTAPILAIGYTGSEPVNEIYYNTDRTAMITVTEHNFNASDVQFTVTAKDVNGDPVDISAKEYDTYLQKKENWNPNGDEYTATLPVFDIEAMYTIKMTYTDLAGNEQVKVIEDKFCIDKTKPEIVPDNFNPDNTSVNENIINSDRTVTFTVTEQNFDAADIDFELKALDAPNGKAVEGVDVSEIEMELKQVTMWTSDGEVHTVSIPLSVDAWYSYTLKYTDLAGNEQKAEVTDLFCIDKTAPDEYDDIAITIDRVNVDNPEPKAGEDKTIVFNKFYNKEVCLKIDTNCNVSGLEKIQYQKVNSVLDYNETGEWTDYDAENGIVVTPNEKFVLYTKVTDKANNSVIANSTGIVVDNQLPIGETKAPEIDIIFDKPNSNGYYTKNIEVDFAVIDPAVTGNPEADNNENAEEQNEGSGDTITENGYYSGLSKIVYYLSSKELDKTIKKELFAYELSAVTGQVHEKKGATYDDDNLASAWNGSVTINAKDFSCNDLVVKIVATDNAGNTRITETKPGAIKIDVTAPEVKVVVGNSEVEGENFFKADRTATITIKELNFAKEDVKLTITNTDGEIPGISEWKTSGSGNEKTWTAEVQFTKDGDYEMNISFADKAGNKSKDPVYEGVAPQKFTIDKTIPEIEVTYNNNDALNENYYKESRTATISVKEHNFDPEQVTVTMTGTDDGAGVSLPGVSSWTSSGDIHTATISYDNDALYTFDIAMKDKAGNESEDFTEQTFYVDKTVPELTIEGIEKFANNDTIEPVITFSDTNIDTSKAEIILEGVNRGRVELDGSYSDIHNGRIFRFKNFKEEKEVDDIYTLTVNLTDKAGNTMTDSVKFSVNRFGSTYDLTEIADINGKYVKEAKDLVITEVNVNELSNIKLTLFKNNQTIILEKDVDYKIVMQGSEEQGYTYTYTIFKEICDEDGVYRLVLHSEDASGNIAENTLDVKDKEISFGIDSTVPNINITNLESKTTYVLENLSVIMLASDNLLLDSITVYLDDFNTAYMTWNAEEIAEVLAGTGEFIFDVPGGSSNAHNVKVVCVDAAGNEQVVEINDFYVTTDAWVRYVNNKPLFYGSIGGGVGLVVMAVLFVTRKVNNKVKK